MKPIFRPLLCFLFLFIFSSYGMDQESCHYQLRVTHVADAPDSLKIKISKTAANVTQTCSFVANFATHACENQHNLFAPFTIAQGVAFSEDENNCLLWNIPDFGLIKLQPDGTMFFGHDVDDAPLMHDTLTLYTSGKLFLQTLKVAALQLESRETQVCGALIADGIATERLIYNTGSLQTTRLLGVGTFLNEGRVEFKGTQGSPALLGIQRFENRSNNHCTPTVSADHLRITKSNKYLSTAKNSNFEVSGKLAIDQPVGIVHFHNEGVCKIHEGNLQRHITNDGFFQANTLTAQSIENKEFGQIKILDRINLGSLDNEGEIDVNKSIEVQHGTNKGTVAGSPKFALVVNNEMKNHGNIRLHQLMGRGYLRNYKTLLFNDNAAISIKNITNEGLLKAAPSLALYSTALNNKVSGIIELYGKSAISNATITNAGNLCIQDGDIDFKSTTLRNYNAMKFRSGGITCVDSKLYNKDKGNWLMENIKSVQPLEMDNEGVLELTDSSLHFEHMRNYKELLIRGGTPTFKELINSGVVKTDLLQLVPNAHLQNLQGGSVQVFERSMIDHAKLVNDGHCMMQGDADIISASISNKGKMTWRSGALVYKNSWLQNEGDWLIEGVTSADPLGMTTNGVLELIDSSLHFGHLINYNDLVLHSGSYRVNDFKNKTLHLCDTDWAITSDAALPADNKLVLTNPNIKDADLGLVQGEHKLTYNLAAMPSSLQAVDIDLTGPDNRLCTLQQLQAIKTTGKVIARCSPEQLAQGDIEFPSIGHLELFVTGPLTKYGTLKAPALTLHVQGALTIGKNNAGLGIIAAINGPLIIEADSIDGRFAQLYGKGKTDIIATKGDIVIGAEARGVDESIKQQFIRTVCNSYGTLWDPSRQNFDASLSVCNGAGAASGDFLTLRSPTKLSVNYGALRSVLGAHLIAPTEVTNWSGNILSYGPITIESDFYNHTRSTFSNKGSIWPRWNAYAEYPGSVAAMLESLNTITFKTKKIHNRAGFIRAAEDIIMNNIIIHEAGDVKKPGTGYVEEPQHFYYRGIGWTANNLLLTQSCTVQAGKTIQMNLGNFVITGNMNAPGILMFASTGLFANSSLTRDTKHITQPILVDVTQFMRQEAQQPGFYQLGAQGAVQTQFPFGTPSAPQAGDLVALENPAYVTPLNWQTIFNPLSSINLDLHLQQLLSNVAGKVYAGRARGNALSRVFWGNANRWRQQQGKQIMSQSELQHVTQSMLLAQIMRNNMTDEQRTLLCIAPQDFNPYQSPGDIVADEFVCVTQGNQTHLNDRIIAQGTQGITVQSQTGDVHMQTQAYTVQYGDSDGAWVTEQRAYPQQQLIAQAGPVNVTAHQNINRVGTAIAAAEHAIEHAQTGSVNKQQLVLQKIAEKTDVKEGFFSSKTTITTNVSHNILPSTTIAGTLLHDRAGTAIHAVAPQDAAGQEIVYESPNTVIEGIIVADCTTTKTQNRSMFSKQSTYQSQDAPCAMPATIQAPIVRLVGDAARVNATITARELHDDTIQGAQFVALVKEMLYENQTLVNSPFMSLDAGCKGGYEVMIQPMFMVDQIIRNRNVGHMLFESAIIDKTRTQIIGDFVETTYQLKKWEERWCHKSQLVSDEALVLIALAIAVVTQGMGVELLAGVLETVTAATGMQLTAAGVAMVNAGVTAICCATTTSFLSTGDPLQTVEHLASDKFLKSLAVSMASAGLCSQLSDMLDINMARGIKPLVDHAQEQALRSTVDALLNVAINDMSVDQALGNACKQIPLNAVAAYVSNQICTSYLNSLGQKIAHTALGGLSGFSSNNNSKGFVSGAIGALTAQTVGDILTADAFAISDAAVGNLKNSGNPLTPENIHKAIDQEINYRMKVAKVTAGTIAALAKLNSALAMQTAANVIDNDMAIRAQVYAMAEMQSLLTAASQAVVNLTVRPEQSEKPVEQPVPETKSVGKKRQKPVSASNSVRLTAEEESNIVHNLVLRRQPEGSSAIVLTTEEALAQTGDLIMQCAQEWQPHNYAQQKQRRSLLDRIVNPEKSPFIKETSEIIRAAFDYAINETINTYAYVPNPVGLGCFAAETGRDIYQKRTTVGEFAFNAALTYGALKGIQLTGRGIKKLYDYAQSKLRRSAPELYVSSAKNSLVGKSAHVTPGTDSVLNKPGQEKYAVKRRIPFVEDPLAAKWSRATISGDVVLGSDAFNIAYERCTRPTWKIDPAAPFNVVGHGTPSVMIVNTQMHPKALSQANLRILKEKGEVILNAVQVARVIRTAPGYKKGQHIHLFSCETGARADGIAQKVSTRMGVEVSAFTEDVHVFNDKPLFVTYSKATEKVGAVKIFYPKSGVSKAVAGSILLSGCDSSSSSSSTVPDEQQTGHRGSLMDRIINPEKSPFIEASSEIISTAFKDAVKNTVNTFAYIPNPVGLACFAAETGRDIYQGETTVGEVAFNAALTYGALKGIQLTGRGIKRLYQKARHACTKSVPFVQDAQAGKWKLSEITMSDDLILHNFAPYLAVRSRIARNKAAPFNVIANGGPDYICINRQGIHPGGLSKNQLLLLEHEGSTLLTSISDIGRLIQTAPGYFGQSVNLMSCNGGARAQGLAQQLSTYMRVPITAFKGKIVYKADGSKFAAVISKDNRRAFGVMKTFYPEKSLLTRLAPIAAALPVLLLTGSDHVDTRPTYITPISTYNDLTKEYAQQRPFVDDPNRGIWRKACISGNLMLQAGTDEVFQRMMQESWEKDERCPFNITAHGSSTSVEVQNKNIHAHGLNSFDMQRLLTTGSVILSASGLARLTKTARDYKGQHINLYSCECGSDPEGFAQQFADEMEVPVSAFTGTAVSRRVPYTRVFYFTSDGWLPTSEKIKTFYPRPVEQRRISNLPKWAY